MDAASLLKTNELAKSLAPEEGVTLDWDEGAGEDWISVVNPSERIAIVSVSLPLALSLRDITPKESTATAAFIAVPSFTEEYLSCTLDSYERAFRYAGHELVVEKFSAWDLWYDTL